ncbi:MAG TPA: HAMP domain-containing sensor histidine kinase [Gemmatimonadales bacterium]|nr:HAMP domain-containing sensor histidine kinase [Gemmatimonadales bacterium]
MNALPLRVRLALVFGAGFAVLLTLGAVVLDLHLARGYSRDFDRTLLDAGHGVRALFHLDRQEFPTAEQTVAHAVGELVYGDRTLVAFDSTGTFLASSQRGPGEPWFNDVPAAGPLGRIVTMQLREGTARVFRTRLDEGVLVAIAMGTLPLENRLYRLRRSLFTVLPAILLAGVVLGTWGARLVLRPIIRVAGEAERIGAEVAAGATEFDRLPPHPVGDEISTLTGAFNRLVDGLSAALARERGVAERQRQFLADAAHELRTPVAILRSEAEVAIRSEDPVEHRASLQRIAEESGELSALVNDLLLMARGDSSALVRHRERVYLDDLLNQAITRARALPPADGREFRRLEFEAAPVQGEATLLERAILSLLHNALLHAPGSPIELSVGTAHEDGRDWSWLTVRDRGPGIPTEHRTRIFDRFARVHASGPGSGLGLAIARAIVEAHGGTITLLEVTPGAAFRIRMPRA